MKTVIQRVKLASVSVDGSTVSSIGPGILTLLGFSADDDEKQLYKMIQKISELRIFSDDQGKMNRSLRDTGYEHLIVPQFTLVADCTSGRRPSFIHAAKLERAKMLYEQAIKISKEQGILTQGGIFQADMQVHLINDGPITFLL